MSTKRLFLSYAKEDQSAVERFYALARARGFDVFMDSHGLKPGAWKPQIEGAIARSEVFILFLSRHVKNKIDNQTGFVESEINYAYNIAMNSAPSTFRIIPVRLDEHYRGDFRSSIFHQYDLFNDFNRQASVILSAIDISSPVQQLVDRASLYYAARDYLNAYTTIALIEEHTGITAESASHRAALLYNMGKTEQAVALLKAICQQKSSLNAHLVLATILSTQRRQPELIAHLQVAADRYPESLEIRKMLFNAEIESISTSDIVESPIGGNIFFGYPEITSVDCWEGGGTQCRLNPHSPPLIKIGSRVEVGGEYCFILLMGELNAIQAEQDFVVKALLVKDGDFVDYHQPILEVVYLRDLPQGLTEGPIRPV